MAAARVGWAGTARLPALAFALLPVTAMYANRGAVILLMLAALSEVAWRIGARDRTWPLGGPATVLLVAFLVWGAASALWAEVGELALHKAGMLLGLVAAGALAFSAGCRQPERVGRWTQAGLWAAALLVGAEYATDMAPSRFLHTLLSGEPPSAGVVIPARFKAAASVAVLLAAPHFFFALRRGSLVSALGAAGAALVLMAVSGSYGAGLGLICAAAAGTLARFSPRVATWCLGAAAVAVFAFAAFAVHLPTSQTLHRDYPWLPNSALHRAEIWRFAASKAIERPILGWGLDASRELPGGETKIDVWLQGEQGRPMAQQALPLHPHNFALQVWLETGAVGAALFFGLLVSLALPVSRLDPAGASAVAAAFGAALPIAAVSVGIWQSWWVATLWLAATFAATLAVRRKAETKAR